MSSPIFSACFFTIAPTTPTTGSGGAPRQCASPQAVSAPCHTLRRIRPEVDAGDVTHSDEVARPGQERSEGRRERLVAARGQPGRGGDHLLFGDEHLEVPVRVGVRELGGVGGVLVSKRLPISHANRTMIQRPFEKAPLARPDVGASAVTVTRQDSNLSARCPQLRLRLGPSVG
jgi:hypothetical protein